MLLNCIEPILLAECAESFRQVVGHKSISIGQNIFGSFGHLPPGHVKMKAVNESQIELLWQWLKQVRCGTLNQRLDWLIEISDEYQRCVRVDLYNASTKPAVRHVVFHNLDGVRIRYLHSTNFVKSYHIPMPHQSDLSSRVVVEQIC